MSRATLYAYVSRGLIRSEPAGQGRRQHRYRAEDVRALRQRREVRRDPDRVAEGALRFGTPLLDSQLTLITDQRLYYRGHDVEPLARRCAIEQVAMLLWTGDLDAAFPDELLEPLRPDWDELASAARRLPPLEAFQVALSVASASDPGAWDLAPASVVRTGAKTLRALAALLVSVPMSRRPVAEVLCEGWSLPPEARGLLDATLVLMADHELNVSTFTTRCVASAGANPYAAVVAGLSALRGPLHGGASDHVEALFDEVGEPARIAHVLRERLRRGEPLPGLGHTLYPEVDPRAALLSQLMREAGLEPHVLDFAEAIADEAWELIGRRPNIDFAAVTLRRALGLPRGSCPALFAIGRSSGWVAHLLEQYAEGRLIRPRARYVGDPPQVASEADVAGGGETP